MRPETPALRSVRESAASPVAAVDLSELALRRIAEREFAELLIHRLAVLAGPDPVAANLLDVELGREIFLRISEAAFSVWGKVSGVDPERFGEPLLVD